MNTELENFLSDFPIYEYVFLKPEQIHFSERVRTICKEECERYGTCWSCPPAVGPVETCKAACLTYKHALFFSSVSDCTDKIGMEAILETKKEHEEITQAIYEFCKEKTGVCLALSSESCELCTICTYPHAPCRFPKQMHPCIESYGILVNDLTEVFHMDYMLDETHMLWFSILFYQ